MEHQKNIVWHESAITRADREKRYGHKSFVLWFTGLSGSGKSTLANEIEKELFKVGCKTYVLDGDNIRHGLNSDLGFTDEDRKENIRRVGELCRLFVDAGMIVCTAFISPFRDDREKIRNLFQPGEFIEIYLQCPLEICENRDPKGLYQKVRSGEITNFTGIHSPYEEPLNPEITLPTDKWNIRQSVTTILGYLQVKELL